MAKLRKHQNPIVKLESISDAIHNCATNREKIGAIYRISEEHLSFECSHCEAEFPLLIQFTAHVQTHLLDVLASFAEPNDSIPDEFEDIDIKPAVEENFGNCTENIELIIVGGQYEEGLDVENSDSSMIIDGSKFDAGGVRSDADFDCLPPEGKLKQQPLLAKRWSAQRTTLARTYECYVCQAPFVTRDECGRHLGGNHMSIAFRCPVCGQSFDNKATKTEHMKNHEKQYHCDECGNRFHLKTTLKTHRWRKHRQSRDKNRTFMCSICKKTWASSSSLWLHMRRHNRANLLHCSQCEYSAPNQNLLGRHIKTHSEQRDFQCDLCPRAYKRKATLDAHKQFHLDKNRTVCSICNKVMTTTYSLRQHMRRHSGQNFLHCSLCDFKCPIQSELDRHMSSHMNRRNFTCDLCPSAFNRKSGLVAHKRTHLDDEPNFQCEQCGVRFAYQAGLKRHMLVHSGIRNHKCDRCPKTYAHSYNLLAHRRTHKENFIYNCDLCGEKFAEKLSLKKHLMSAHDRPGVVDATGDNEKS